MSELVDFLTARLDEDEAAANRRFDNWRKDGGVLDLVDIPGPARVLREVTAKRAILALHPVLDSSTTVPYCYQCSDDHYACPYPCPTVRALAAPFSDHPDFQEQWR